MCVCVVKYAASCLHHGTEISLWQVFVSLFKWCHSMYSLSFALCLSVACHIYMANSTAKLLLKNAKRKCCHISLNPNNKNLNAIFLFAIGKLHIHIEHCTCKFACATLFFTFNRERASLFFCVFYSFCRESRFRFNRSLSLAASFCDGIMHTHAVDIEWWII